MLFKQVLLQTIIRLDGNRSVAAIYHLITGRTSIQTKQDAHLFNLTSFYGIYQSLDKRDFDREIRNLQKDQYILIETGERLFPIATRKAVQLVDENPVDLLACLKGSDYGKAAHLFMEKLLLFIQTIANINGGNNSFVAVVDDRAIQNWIRQYFRSIRGSEQNVLKSIQFELTKVLKSFTDSQAQIFIDRLSGLNHYGMGLEQLAGKHGMNVNDVYLLLAAMQHKIMDIILNKPQDYLVLSSFVQFKEHKALAESAAITKRMLDQGMDSDSIANLRSLKQNTIQDHIVEIALHDPLFDISPYLPKHVEEEIKKAMNDTKSGKLKDIRQALPEGRDYFQIRLALARWN